MGDDTVSHYSVTATGDSLDASSAWSINYAVSDLKIRDVENGYIADVCGSEYVFTSFKALVKWLAKRYDEKL